MPGTHFRFSTVHLFVFTAIIAICFALYQRKFDESPRGIGYSGGCGMGSPPRISDPIQRIYLRGYDLDSDNEFEF